jgi:acyl-coenzyme A thioesterase PaaI-like protein
MNRERPVPESWHSRFVRWGLNCWPCYLGTGGRVTFAAADWREVHVRLPLSFATRNVVGTIFGGSMYGAIDPVYAVMLIRIFGPGVEVWDKSAAIRFLRPGRGTLRAAFVLHDAELEAIRAALDATGRAERTWVVELVDDSGVAHARIEKVISLRRRENARPA